ncbi:arsenic resistance protein [Microbacterium sp.]|uniref:arsenic resistance protein n=1 Tax=Microbacterium sp. TaxID=51671 RepID=UPI0039E3B863
MLSTAARPGAIVGLFIAAIVVGSGAGAFLPGMSDVLGRLVDPAILTLVVLLVFTLRLDSLATMKRAPRTLLLALALNFALVPVLAFVLTSLLLPSDALRLGVLIYCLSPCTDWFLGFTRIAGGDTATGAALIPIQMAAQLLLYPIWLALFTGQHVAPAVGAIFPTLAMWFALPTGIAIGLRLLLRRAFPPRLRETIVNVADRGVPLVIAVVIVGLFAGNVGAIQADIAAFGSVLLVVSLFFAVVYALGEGISRVFRLDQATHVLLTMTTSARNAPLMLAVTAVALPGQPVVYAAIILGMLIEFPHLTALTHLVRRRPPQPQPVALLVDSA